MKRSVLAHKFVAHKSNLVAIYKAEVFAVACQKACLCTEVVYAECQGSGVNCNS